MYNMCVITLFIWLYTVKYSLVQNAQYKVKYQSVLFLPTHRGIPSWFGLGI